MKRLSLDSESNLDYIIIGILVSALLVAGAFLSTRQASAGNSIIDKVNVTIPISCSFTDIGTDSHTERITNGTYRNDIGTTTLRVFCNDTGGFAIYAIGFTGDQYEGEDHTKLIGASTNRKVVTGTATTAGNPDVSNWAMKLATNSSATYPITLDNGYSSYNVVPDTYTKVAHRDSATDIGTAATGTELTTTYAAYISKTQPADAYTGKVKYTLVHPSSETPLHPETTQAEKTCYYPNGGDVVGAMGCQDVASSVTLLASNFSRQGYGFAGWNDEFDYTGNFYGPNETITLDTADYSTTGLSLYAVWVKSEGSLQDSSKVASICSRLTAATASSTPTLDSVSALTDQRDNETYAIAKLADGNCWMIENLRLENTASHNSDGALAQGYAKSTTYGNFSGLADAETTISVIYRPNSLYSEDGSNNTINIGTSDYPAYRIPRYNNLNTPEDASDRPQNPTSNTYSTDNTTVGMYSYGNYYSWSAAMANTIYYDSPTATDVDGKTSDNVNTSICPSGWRLPYGNTTGNGATSGGFSNLDIKLGGTGADQSTTEASNRWRKFPNNFLYAGLFTTSAARDRGVGGYYWTSTAHNSGSSHPLVIDYSGVILSSGYNKAPGKSVRCVVPSE